MLEADVVVTATGLKLLPFGGIAPSVDGETVDLHEQFVWQGAMITGLPNFAVCIGYTNASWTLRADLTHRLVCRVLNHLDAARLRRRRCRCRAASSRSARCSTSARATSSARSTQFPRQGDRGPWRVRQNYLLDSVTTMRPWPARVDGVHAAVRRTHSRRAARGRRADGVAGRIPDAVHNPGRARALMHMFTKRPRVLAALATLGLVPALLSVTGQAQAVPAAPQAAAPAPYSATITRTEHGIPHIVAKDFGSLGFGSGYAAAGTSICTLADTVLTGRGQRSRYLGADRDATTTRCR